MKKCSKCKLLVSIDLFYKDKNSKDGMSYWCNICIVENIKRHRESPEYRAKQCEWNQKWRDEPENRKKILQIRIKSQKKIYNILKKAGFVTDRIRQIILKRDNNKCSCCGDTDKLTIDHIIPISKGGITDSSNLQTLCVSCNSKKMQKTINYRNL